MNHKDDKQQNIQKQLDFSVEPAGEAREAGREETESSGARNETEKPASTERVMEAICEWENLKEAMGRVKANKGSAGIDGMTVGELPDYSELLVVREQLLSGSYKPQPVKRVEIPKPDGGVRKLGIPTALDRFVQQAVMQVLQRQWDRTFSDSSYGFRPGRSTHQAVEQAQQYIAAGHGWVVDLDLEKFFDRVNHDKLMGQIAERVRDKRLLKLIRAFLNAGVMENGLVSPSVEGTPQGGPLSPLLSNLVLDELDRELERRGHRFVRYADDCNIYVRSERAGQRVMDSIQRFITQRLKLKVNEKKSAVATARAEVSRIQFHRRTRDSAQDRADGGRAVQGTDSGNHAAGQKCEPGDDDGDSGPVYAGLAWLLRILPDSGPADQSDSLGAVAPSGGAVATMENPTPPSGDADSLGCTSSPGG
jgi:RNA-directed DNA polymerase